MGISESATRSIMTAKDLAYLIKFDGNYKDGMTVWLFSCNTGKGQNSFASQLAKELHTNVIGPDTLWTWWGRGTNGKLKMDTVLTAPTAEPQMEKNNITIGMIKIDAFFIALINLPMPASIPGGPWRGAPIQILCVSGRPDGLGSGIPDPGAAGLNGGLLRRRGRGPAPPYNLEGRNENG